MESKPFTRTMYHAHIEQQSRIKTTDITEITRLYQKDFRKSICVTLAIKFWIPFQQVVFPGTFHGQEVSIAGAAGLGYGNALAAGKVIAGDAPLGLTDILHGTRRHDLAAVNARAGAHIHDIVRAAHGILVVLDHDDGITEVPQVLQGRNELIVVTLVQANAGLVQHIEHAGQRTADLGGEADALAFAAGQGASRAGQGQVVQTHALQKLQAVPDLLHDLTADLPLLLGPVRLIFGNKFQLIPDGHFAELADVLIPNGHCQHHRLQALAVAVRALHAGHLSHTS